MGRPQVIRSRSRWLYALFVAGAVGLSGRLVYLQVVAAPHLSALAQQQHTHDVNLASVRGEIVDRNGRELAVSVDAASIYAQPSDYTMKPEAIAERLAPVLNQPLDQVRQEVAGSHWHWIVRQQEESIGHAVRAMKIPGIGVVRESKRLYPKGTLGATLLGFVGADNQGLAGIEHDFDKVLLGKARKLEVQVDAHGREILREGGSPLRSIQTDGARVVLTLDETIQHIAQRELAASLERLQAKRGAVLVMNPENGDILAYALMPTYDPNQYKGLAWESIKNWVANDVYEPGSTMKVFTIASALDAGRITPATRFDCPPTYSLAGHTISDHEAPAGIRHLSPEDILQVSSNVGALQVGLRMPDTVHRDHLVRFGFGSVTGSGIHGESKGLLSPIPWPAVRQGSISFGYGISVTPLQILAAASAIADDGRRHVPRLIDRVDAPDGHLLQAFPPATPSQVVSPQVARTVRQMLQSVVERGTGTAARVPGYNVAGKTGTANKSQGGGYSSNVIASFLGFVPAEKPKLVILALIDSPQNAHFAASTAAPLFQAVAGETLRYLGVPPTVPTTVEKPPDAPR
jgi:cell division protein FtsI (penicillin-binding protein 3)